MARLFGLIGNRADLASRVLELEREVLFVPAGLVDPSNLSWGLGFYQGGEVLLRRRPTDERTALDMAALAYDLRTDLLIGHVRAATVGGIRTENTHPFRYGEWLFAHTGSVNRFASIRQRMIESIPEFLQKNVRGDTDSEILFHLVLSFLHDAGRLQAGAADARSVVAALASTTSLIDQLAMEEGGEAGFPLNAMLTNGEILAALHRDDVSLPDRPTRMMMRVMHGRADLDLLVADDALRRVRLTDPGALRFTLFASDFGPAQRPDLNPQGTPMSERPPPDSAPTASWTPLPPHAIVVATRDAPPLVETF